MTDKPVFKDAPGVVLRLTGRKWEARWQARTDLVDRGFKIKSEQLWAGHEPTDVQRNYVADRARELQDQMLAFSREIPEHDGAVFDGTLESLIRCYQTDPDSGWHKLRYRSRRNHEDLLRRLTEHLGHIMLEDINARKLLAWHKCWTHGIQCRDYDSPPMEYGPRTAMAHSLVGQVRTLIGFGLTLLEDQECVRIATVMHKMRFKQSKPRTEALTVGQATAIRMYARYHGWYSIALAQSFQWECTLRQRDCVGEFVPLGEPGVSDVTATFEVKGKPVVMKWLRGIRWEEIDDRLILTHITSKREKELVVDLHNAPMVLEELEREYPGCTNDRSQLPASGPIVVCEYTRLPFEAGEFRRKWRAMANGAKVPKSVRNMDSRAGAITEATMAGASLEDIRHAATHSDISMTQRYARGAEQKVANVMQLRVASRNKAEPK